MAVHINSIGPAIPLSTAPARSHAAASSGRGVRTAEAAGNSAEPQAASGFHAVLSVSAPGSRPAQRPVAQQTSPSSAGAGTTAQAAAASTANNSAPGASPSSPTTLNPNASYTAQQVFGANPWLANPTGTGPNGITFGYNPLYFATPQTAAEVAQMVGGKVVEDNEFTKNTYGTPFAQQQPNEMVQLANGALINPGLVASLFTHGLPQWEVNQAIANEVASAEASVKSVGS